MVNATAVRPEAATCARGRNTFVVAVIVSLLVWLVVAALLATDALDGRGKQVLVDTCFVLFPLPGVAYGIRAVLLTDGRLRQTWGCFTATLVCWAIGNVVWFYYEILADVRPYPTVGDAFFVLAIVFAAIGLLLFPTGTRAKEGRSRLLLDGLSVGCALLFVSDIYVLDDVFAAMGSGLGGLVFVTYPVADVLLASMAVLLLTRSPRGIRPDLVLLALGLLVYAAADTAYALQGAHGEFQVGTLLDLGWLGGYILVGLAALAPTALSPEAQELRDAGTNRSGALLVHGTLAAAILVGFLGRLNDPAEYILAVAMLVLVGLRQVILTRDNQELQDGLGHRVAERKADLDRLSSRHQRILEAVAEGVYGVDTEGRITFMNPAAGRLLGFTTDELIGRKAHEAFHEDHGLVSQEGAALGASAPEAECHVMAAVKTGDVIRAGEGRYVRSDGHRFPVELTAAPKQDANGIAGAVVVFSDITERRELERMKEEFVSVVSHELRTPLTAIRGAIGLLAGGALGELPPTALRMVDLAQDNITRLSRLINDILDLERVQSGAIPLELGVHESADLVQTTLTALEPIASEADVVLVSDVPGGRVHGDADRLVQALTNLIGNAVKFSPPAGRVVVSAKLDDAHVTFTVRDEGRGIPAEQLESIFDRFQQVDSSDAREKGGSGLGLAITKSIVERHGGRIWVESKPGQGSAFHFTIPAALRPVVPELEEGDRRPGAPVVLVCDDDPDVLAVISKLLCEHGYEVKPVARGRDAIDLAISARPEVILLDLRMPGMSGWETMQELKSLPDTRDIPIVILSGLGPQVDPQLAAESDGWVTKPFDERRMAEAILAAVHGDGQPPMVLVVEDDDDLASILVTIFEGEGLTVARAASQSQAVEWMREATPDVLVLDIHLLDGDGYGVVEDLRRDGRLPRVPIIVYSAQELDQHDRKRLGLGEMVFLTKSRDSPQDLARRVVSVVHSMAPRTATTTNRERTSSNVETTVGH